MYFKLCAGYSRAHSTTAFLLVINIIQPLAIGLTLLTVLICLISGLITKTFWFSYILFLIFLGGILVLFIYVTSLASNEIFNLSIKLTLISTIIIFLFLSVSFIINKNSTTFFLINNEIERISKIYSYILDNSLSLNKLYNFPTNFLTILLINYLLITLIVVVKITKIFKGPLRVIN